jgi:hypothetical protein
MVKQTQGAQKCGPVVHGVFVVGMRVLWRVWGAYVGVMPGPVWSSWFARHIVALVTVTSVRMPRAAVCKRKPVYMMSGDVEIQDVSSRV